MGKRIQVYTAKCRRGCGKVLATTNRSIWGDEEGKRKYELICENCLTDEEKSDMFDRQVKHIRTNFCKR